MERDSDAGAAVGVLAAPVVRRRSAIGRRAAEGVSPYLYVLPAVAILLVFHVFPILYVVYLSFHRATGLFGTPSVGLSDYQRLLSDPEIRDSLRATIEFTLGTVPVGAVLALLLALLLFDRLPLIGLFRTFILLPFITPVVATTIVWQWIFNAQYGFLDSILIDLHLQPVSWFADPFWAMVVLCAYSLWHEIGFTVLIMLAGLTTIDTEVREAARIDGAGPWREFLHITLPLMSPWIFFVLVVNVIGAFKVFTQVLTLTGGGPGNATAIMGYLIEKIGFQYFDLTYAAALSVAVLALVSLLTLAQFAVGRRRVFYQ